MFSPSTRPPPKHHRISIMQSLLQVRCDFPPTKANIFESVPAVALERKHGTNARVGGYMRPMFCTHRWGMCLSITTLRFWHIKHGRYPFLAARKSV